ncbi:hypothetical protein [Rummeliibacillus pycnus]|uniref:hypothetical protein n=1 Tax=Rummeliibacillus pycnus TaxID=101070 RepID=UPI003D2BDDBC
MKEQVNDQAKRFFEYLLALSSLDSKVIRSIKDYEKIWKWDELAEIEGCTIGNQDGHTSNLLEIHKPNPEQFELNSPSPFPELDKWMNVDDNKVLSTPTYKDILQLDEKIFKEIENQETIKLDSQRLSEWKEWLERKKQFVYTNTLYSELLELIKRLDQENHSIELVISKGLLKWRGVSGEEEIELPLFTTNVLLSVDTKTGTITLQNETEGLQFENDLFSGITLPNKNEIQIIIEKIEQLSFLDDISNELKQLVQLIDPAGKFIGKSRGTHEDHGTVVIDQSLLILRTKNTNIVRKDLQQIISLIDQNQFDLPDSIHAFLGDSSKHKAPSHHSIKENFIQSAKSDQVYFPLDASDQQKEIIKRINRYNGVAVQVPSKLAKTHTMANLVSHFLAEGKKILVTSQEDQPLKELKEMIPEEISDLCVTALGEEATISNEIEQSIRKIEEKIQELDVQTLKENVERNLQRLNHSIQNEALCRESLKKYAKSEGTPILYQNQQLFKHEVAKRLAETDVYYQWILDELPLIMKLPLSTGEWENFCRLQNAFKKSDSELFHTNLPSLEHDILSEIAFKMLFEEENILLEEIDLQYILPIELTSSKKSTLLIMKALVEEIIENHMLVENEIFSKFIRELLATEKRREYWIQLIEEIKQYNEKAQSLYNDLSQHTITLPKKLSSEIQLDLIIAREKILSGKKPNQLFFMTKGKSAKYLFQTAILNGKPLENLEDVTTVQKHIEYKKIITKLARLFNVNMNEIGISGIDITEQEFTRILEERIEILSQIINIVNQEIDLSAKLQMEQLQTGNIFDLTFYENLKTEIEQTLLYIKYEKWQEKYELEIEKLANLAQLEDMNVIAKHFLMAMLDKDYGQWKALITELKELYKVSRNLKRWEKYIDKLAEKLPLTVESIKNNFGTVKLEEDHYEEAFVLRKMESWLKEESESNMNELKEQLQNERKIQKKLLQEIVTDAAWASQIERKADGEQSAQTTVPVWMMSIHQVLQHFPITNDKFDVIILDESSQCDLFSINVLLRGEKVIVVGNDEQISTPSIGTNHEAVAELIHRYISDVPNRSLYDGEISLYKIAEQNFPKDGKLNVPEMIPFTNDVSDTGERLPLEVDQLEPLCESSFESDVLKRILSKGYHVTPQVKVGLYKIDFVIKGLHDRLAVECEGDKWQGSEKYEEIQEHQESLERAGWKFWCINGRDFYANQEEAMERLWIILDEMGILPIGQEETSKVLHDFSLNVQNEQEPSIQFQIQNKKLSIKPIQESILTNQLVVQKIFDENDATIENEVEKEPINENGPINATLIYTNKEKFDSKIFSVSTINDIPPELIQNVLIQGNVSIVKFLNDLGFEIIDYRLQDGSLWVVANEEVKPFMEKLEAFNVSFRYISKGSQTTKGHPAWYTKILD